MVRDVTEYGEAALVELAPRSQRDIMEAPGRMLAFSPAVAGWVQQFHDFLYKEVYGSPSVDQQSSEARGMMRRLFDHYCAQPETMGRKARARVEREGLERTVCDYLSGFTDRYALEEHARHGL